jgi:DNA-binding Lrp family transcriptional regulator
MAENQPKLEAQQQEKVKVSDVFSKATLNLLEFLVQEKTEKYYSPSDIANVLGISPSTVSKICRKLLDLNILTEKTYLKAHVGRPIKIREINYRNQIAREMATFIRNFSDYLNGRKETDNPY